MDKKEFIVAIITFIILMSALAFFIVDERPETPTENLKVEERVETPQEKQRREAQEWCLANPDKCKG